MSYRVMVTVRKGEEGLQRQEIEYRVSSALELFDRLMRCRNRFRIMKFYLLPRDLRKHSEILVARVNEWGAVDERFPGGGFWMFSPSDPDELEELAFKVWEEVVKRGSKYPGIYEL